MFVTCTVLKSTPPSLLPHTHITLHPSSPPHSLHPTPPHHPTPPTTRPAPLRTAPHHWFLGRSPGRSPGGLRRGLRARRVRPGREVGEPNPGKVGGVEGWEHEGRAPEGPEGWGPETWKRVGSRRVGPWKVEPEGWAPEVWGPKISRLFSPLQLLFSLFFSLWEVFSWNFGGVFEAPGPSNVHVWALGLSCEVPADPIPREDSQER